MSLIELLVSSLSETVYCERARIRNIEKRITFNMMFWGEDIIFIKALGDYLSVKVVL